MDDLTAHAEILQHALQQPRVLLQGIGGDGEALRLARLREQSDRRIAPSDLARPTHVERHGRRHLDDERHRLGAHDNGEGLGDLPRFRLEHGRSGIGLRDIQLRDRLLRRRGRGNSLVRRSRCDLVVGRRRQIDRIAADQLEAVGCRWRSRRDLRLRARQVVLLRTGQGGFHEIGRRLAQLRRRNRVQGRNNRLGRRQGRDRRLGSGAAAQQTVGRADVAHAGQSHEWSAPQRLGQGGIAAAIIDCRRGRRREDRRHEWRRSRLQIGARGRRVSDRSVGRWRGSLFPARQAAEASRGIGFRQALPEPVDLGAEHARVHAQVALEPALVAVEGRPHAAALAASQVVEEEDDEAGKRAGTG